MNIKRFLQTRPGCSVAFSMLAIAPVALAQTNLVPVVTVQAIQPFAGPINPGVFAVFRTGNTNATLNVWYELGGSASNGVDYLMIPPNLVTIPAGSVSSSIVIAPIPTNIVSIPPKTVILSLTNSPLLTPVNYQIGSPSSATVFLGGTNFPPAPVILSPANGSIFYAPTNIPITASIGYSSFPPPNLEFFGGTNELGSGMLEVSSGFGGLIYFTWTNPPPGSFALTAVATYPSLPISVTSAPVNISVLSRVITNLPPVVSLIEPSNGATYTIPANIQMIAKATDPDGTVTNVEFFAGTNDLGHGNPVVLDPPGIGGVTGLVYLFDWMNPLPGKSSLAAVATDNGGLSTVSAPVNITVLGPVTNLPPVVRITSPPSGEVFRAPVNVAIYAYAAAPEGIASVEFFAGGNSLGLGQPVTAVPPPLPPGPIQPPILILQPTNYWELVWTNPPAETNIALTAKATDDGGASTISAPVQISILPPLPPPTNHPALVNIVASDPIAIEGTNCWTWLGLTNPVPTWSNWFAPSAVFVLRTNCGPKDATFTVSRSGTTNDDLTVNYTFGGTATNGVDYVALPGYVLVPAGQLEAPVTIVPLDDGPPDINRTVILTLASGTNYIIGRPSAAAAIILDSQSPRATTGMGPGNLFQITSTGPNGAWFQVEYSADMIHWTPLCTNQVINGTVNFIDPDAASQPGRFYRTLPQSGP